MTHYPLPNLGLCPVCEGEIRIRRDENLQVHKSPRGSDAPIVCDANGYAIMSCSGSNRPPAARLEPTFARWLWTHAARRDYYDNRITRLAQSKFRGCTRSPNRTPLDLPWTTAEELHEHEHQIQRKWTGSDIRQPYNGQRCDWVCQDITLAAQVYEQLVAAAREAA